LKVSHCLDAWVFKLYAFHGEDDVVFAALEAMEAIEALIHGRAFSV
jgi:hypothetical protein